MSISVIYLVQKFFYRIFKFVYNWYVGGFWAVGHGAITIFEGIDQYFAFKITLKHLFQPLYQDRTILGYILGFIFRTFRVLMGMVVYAALFLIVAGIYILWAGIPIYIVLTGFEVL